MPRNRIIVAGHAEDEDECGTEKKLSFIFGQFEIAEHRFDFNLLFPARKLFLARSVNVPKSAPA